MDGRTIHLDAEVEFRFGGMGHAEREERKKTVRNVVIPRSTGLYRLHAMVCNGMVATMCECMEAGSAEMSW